MSTFYIALPWTALFIASLVELNSDADYALATPILVGAVITLGLVMLGARLGGAA